MKHILLVEYSFTVYLPNWSFKRLSRSCLVPKYKDAAECSTHPDTCLCTYRFSKSIVVTEQPSASFIFKLLLLFATTIIPIVDSKILWT